MPKAFALDLDRNQRGAIILQALLLQVPDVKKVTLDKMYAAGLTTLEAMFMATAGDIAATSGIPSELAERIVERFRSYREQVKTTVPDATRARERERVAELTSRLRRENEEHERASESMVSGRGREEEGAPQGARADTARHSGGARSSRRGGFRWSAGAAAVRKQARAPRVVSRGGSREIQGAVLEKEDGESKCPS